MFVSLKWFVFAGGLLHFSLLWAGALAPQVLNWRESLKRLDPLSRQIVWVHGAFVVLTLVGFGLASVFLPAALTGGTPLARALCGFIAFFWAARLGVQFFVFDAKPYLKTAFLKTGYHTLTLVFSYLAVVYGTAAVWG
ncbi:MAG: hypothetical protein K8T25_13240 [Planctomycetia bacterium]|nr:hypothetical protein [Planctomycetia bacterium]